MSASTLILVLAIAAAALIAIAILITVGHESNERPGMLDLTGMKPSVRARAHPDPGLRARLSGPPTGAALAGRLEVTSGDDRTGEAA